MSSYGPGGPGGLGGPGGPGGPGGSMPGAGGPPSYVKLINQMFYIPVIAGSVFIVINIILFITFALTNIKDDQKLGIKVKKIINIFIIIFFFF